MELKDYRQNRGLTQVEVAKRMGVTQVFVSQIEKKENPTVKTLRAYFNAIGYKLDLEPKFVGYTALLKKQDK
jgi:transcriptional regulator with XRE-family HTH domain